MKANYPLWAKRMRVGSWGLSHKDLAITAEHADERARALRSQGANAVVSFGYHFRWDWITEFDRIREATRLSVEACHRYGIKYVEHHSACFVTRLKERTPEEFAHVATRLTDHTVPEPLGLEAVVEYKGSRLNDWFVIDGATGLPDYWQGYRARALCPNNPEYQTHYFAYLEDFLRDTQADGIMSDDVTMGTSYGACACTHCRARFKEKTGLDLPESAGLAAWKEANAPEFRQWADFRAESVRLHYERVGALIDRLGRPLLHTACACNVSSPAAAEIFDREKAYNTTFMEIMHCLHDYYSWRNVLPELRTYRAIARSKDNPAFAIIYPLPEGGEAFFMSAFCRMEGHSIWQANNINHTPGESLDPSWQLWEAEHEALFDAKDSLVCVGVLFSDETRRHYRGIHRDHYTNEFKGWCQALQAQGIDFDVVLGDECERNELGKYKLLVVPNAGCLSELQCRRIGAFVYAGGKAIISHESSLFDEAGACRGNFMLADCLGVDYVQTVFDEHYPLQARVGDDGFLHNVRGLVPHCAPQARVQPRTGTQVVATSYIDGGGLQGSSLPAITRHRHGQGEAVYFSGKPGLLSYLAEARRNSWDGEEPNRFLDYRVPEWGEVIGNAVRVLAAPFPVSLTGAVEGVVFRAYRLKDGGVAIHVLNAAGSLISHKTLIPKQYAVTYPAIAAAGSRVTLQVALGEVFASARLTVPERKDDVPVDIHTRDGICSVTIPPDQLISYGVVVLRAR